MAELQERYRGVPLHYCLQHAKGHTGARTTTTGWKRWVPIMTETVAFQPPPVFHISAELLLEKLMENNQTDAVDFLLFANSPAALKVPPAGVYAAKWNSSFWNVDPGYSLFLNQCVETQWHVADLKYGSTKCDTTRCILDKGQRKVRSFTGNKPWSLSNTSRRGRMHSSQILSGAMARTNHRGAYMRRAGQGTLSKACRNYTTMESRFMSKLTRASSAAETTSGLGS